VLIHEGFKGSVLKDN